MWNIYCENSCVVGMWSVDGAAVVVRTVLGVGPPQILSKPSNLMPSSKVRAKILLDLCLKILLISLSYLE